MLEVTCALQRGTFVLTADFAFDQGVTALFGPSGSGKTTLVRAIAGLERLTSGRIQLGPTTLFDSTQTINLAPHLRRIGMVFQESRLFPHLSVRANLTYGQWAGGAAKSDMTAIVELLGLGTLLARLPGNLSGGERQRVAIGRALLAAPHALMLDEPLANLDAPRREEILPYLDRLKQETKLPILFVSHALDEVTRLADHIVVLDHGQQLAFGPMAEILAKPELGTFFGPTQFGATLHATVHHHEVEWGITQLRIDGQPYFVPRVAADPGAGLRLRILARDIALSTTPPSGTSVQNCLCGTIELIDQASPTDAMIGVILDGPQQQRLFARITRRAVHTLHLASGDHVWCLVKGTATEPRLVSKLGPDTTP